jgi:tetratricopeptide (TPR) repeat protein
LKRPVIGAIFAVLGILPAATAAPSSISIDYPPAGTIFPPDFAAPTFLWRDEAQGVTAWRIEVAFAGGAASLHVKPAGERMRIGEIDRRCVSPNNELPKLTPQQAATRTWKPDTPTWETIKRHSGAGAATVTITGFRSTNPGQAVSRGGVTIRTSTDPVGAPIFYRDVPLMPSELEKGVIKPLAKSAVPLIAWRLRNVAEPRSGTLMQGLPTCANCHSFSGDGKTLGMDLDGPQNDKGLYAIVSVQPQMSIRSADVVSWSSFRGELGSQLREGFMSQLSPDGQYVATTIRPPGTDVQQLYYVANFKDYRFLQVFYPTHGVLAWYNRATGKLQPLPGADDPRYVQANAVWSPDGKYLVFARADAKDAYPPGARPAAYANDPNEPQIQYDLYRIPFNNGQGGRPEPIAGASRNGMSNSFPKVSPDGRWIVYVQSRNGQLMRPDSQLYIVPWSGGAARRMRCNTPLMNSWHSFSPNGRWMVFSSKSRSPYTQMYLTHLDEAGSDTPAILVENATADNRAVNIPEFVNVPPNGVLKIDTPATDFYRLYDAAFELSGKGRYAEAVLEWRKALALDSEDARAHHNFAFALAGAGKPDEAVWHYRKALQLNPAYAEAHHNLGLALIEKGEREEAVAHYQKALEINPRNPETHNSLGVAMAEQGKPGEAIAHFEEALRINPAYAEAHNNLGNALIGNGRVDEAIPHYEKALKINSSYAEACNNLGRALAEKGQFDRALPHFEKAIRLNPKYPEARANLGMALAEKGRLAEAVRAFDQALALNPALVEVRYPLGNALYGLGRTREALANWQRVLSADPQHVLVLNQLAWALATCADASIRNGAEAVRLAGQAVELSGGQDSDVLATLAAAYAEAGRFREAVETASRALDLATRQDNRELADRLRQMAGKFAANTPFRK